MDRCVPILQEQFPETTEQQLRDMMQKQLPQLKHWKK